MKKVFLVVLATFMANVAYAQKMIVYSLMGRVEDVTTGTPKPVKLRDAISPSTILNIPSQGCVVLFDEGSTRQYTLKKPCQATVKEMISDNKNSIRTLTGNYLTFIKKQITSGGHVFLRNCSDPATVTRSLMITASDEIGSELSLCGKDGFSSAEGLNLEQKDNVNPFEKDFQTWRKEMLDDYQSFRKKILQDYAEFVRKPWNEVDLSPAEEKPEDEKITPFIIDDKGGKPVLPDFDKKERKENTDPIISILPLPQPLPIPEPVAPIRENNDVNLYHSFTFFGTEMEVRWSDDCTFRLQGTDENAIADGVELLFSGRYDNLLYDCMQLRAEYHLSDWAYYLMLKEISVSLCGKDTNEATLLMSMLYSQSGYRMRLAMAGTKLLLLVSTQFHLYGFAYYVIDGYNYYLIDGDYDRVRFCDAYFPNEQEMSLIMRESPLFSSKESEIRTFSSSLNSQLIAKVAVNKNLIDFYSTYPSSYFNNDFMTRWAMYANIEMQPEIREQLYPQLKSIIQGKSQREGVESILNWIQTSFAYGYDDKVWGYDRAFFSEESLYYPSCDCEDRSILFTRLIRDLFGLKCILVYYPGHLATGVCFTEKVKGDCDYIDVKGDRYIICDPTIMGLGAPVGWSMSGMNNSTASVIVLD